MKFLFMLTQLGTAAKGVNFGGDEGDVSPQIFGWRGWYVKYPPNFSTDLLCFL